MPLVRFNYGDAQSGNSKPFVQMISTTTDMAAAMAEFKTERAATLSKLPRTADPSAIVNRTVNASFRKSSPLGTHLSAIVVALLSLALLL